MSTGSTSRRAANVPGLSAAAAATAAPPFEWPTPIAPRRPSASQKAATSSATALQG